MSHSFKGQSWNDVVEGFGSAECELESVSIHQWPWASCLLQICTLLTQEPRNIGYNLYLDRQCLLSRQYQHDQICCFSLVQTSKIPNYQWCLYLKLQRYIYKTKIKKLFRMNTVFYLVQLNHCTLPDYLLHLYSGPLHI